MICRLTLLAVAMALVIGCKKKTEETTDPSPVAPGPNAGTPNPNAGYVIKLRDEQAGDKTNVTRSYSRNDYYGHDRKLENGKWEGKAEYSEHILDMPEGAARPSKLTRNYKVSQRYDPRAKALKATEYEGKTVEIAGKGERYGFVVDGKPLPDPQELWDEFNNPAPERLSTLLPKAPVNVGASWPIDVTLLPNSIGDGADYSRCKATGKLTRAYTKEGKQWGVIVFNFDFVCVHQGTSAGAQHTLSTKIELTLDSGIDGIARDRTMKTVSKTNSTDVSGGRAILTAVDSTIEMTIRSAK